MVGHVSPGGDGGGPLALLRDGDLVTVDAATRLLEIEGVDEDEWEQRKVGWEPLPPKYTRGVLGKYAKMVQSAAHGAITG